MTIRIFLFLVALFATTAHARLGETKAEIEQRYGAQMDTSDADGLDGRVYAHKGFGILVQFIDGKSASEMLIKQDKSEFSDEEVKAFLTAYGGGKSWKEDGVHFGKKLWVREDGEAYLQWEKLGSAQCIVTFNKVMIAYKKALEQKSAAEKASSF